MAALVTSGTATLETALFRVPQVVCYYTPVGKFVSFLRRQHQLISGKCRSRLQHIRQIIFNLLLPASCQ